MANVSVFNMQGKEVGKMDLNDAIFAAPVHEHLLHLAVVAQLANKRQGTQKALTRAEVSGGGRKPWRQKGTGRARQGSIRAPHMVGGGVTFGPHPRSYEKKVNKKVRNLALRSALSAKVAAGNVLVLDYDGIETPKTKVIVNLVNKVDAKQKQLFVVGDLIKDYNLYLSARNLENAVILQPNEIGVYWLLKQEKVILTKEALAVVEEVLG